MLTTVALLLNKLIAVSKLNSVGIYTPQFYFSLAVLSYKYSTIKTNVYVISPVTLDDKERVHATCTVYYKQMSEIKCSKEFV